MDLKSKVDLWWLLRTCKGLKHDAISLSRYNRRALNVRYEKQHHSVLVCMLQSVANPTMVCTGAVFIAFGLSMCPVTTPRRACGCPICLRGAWHTHGSNRGTKQTEGSNVCRSLPSTFFCNCRQERESRCPTNTAKSPCQTKTGIDFTYVVLFVKFLLFLTSPHNVVKKGISRHDPPVARIQCIRPYFCDAPILHAQRVLMPTSRFSPNQTTLQWGLYTKQTLNNTPTTR